MRALHQYWAYSVVFTNLAVGLWGLWLWARKQGATKPFWISLGVAWSTIYLQGIFGLALFETYQPPFRHHFYGFLFVIITLMVFPLRGEDPRRALGIFSAATLFIGIVAIRAVFSI